jgi:tripartite-type tricarboxylate transporter receptor subunit TctC
MTSLLARITHSVFSTLLATCCLAAAGQAMAQAAAWPNQPIRLIVPYPPAGATDVLARLLADKLTAANGWNFVLDNKPGAGGNIGMDVVAKARADGYTLGLGQTSNLAINPTLYPKMPYDALKDFTRVAFVAQQPVLVVVRSESPYQTLAQLISAAKAKSGGLTMASAANGTVGHLAGELLARRAGYTMTHVPYKGAAPALTDLLGGQTDFMLPTPQAALPLIKAGRLRALAVTSAQRLEVLADVPTVAESGYAGFEAIDWKVLVGPAGLPADVVKRLNDAATKALGAPDAVAKLHADGSAPLSGTPTQLSQFIEAEHARWGGVVRDAGVKAD